MKPHLPTSAAGKKDGFWGRGLLLAAVALGSIVTVFCQPRLVLKESNSYDVGDQISPEIVVVDKNLKPWPLRELIRPDTRIAVLVLFGGGMKERPDREDFRGNLWCQDSFDDLSVQRAVYHTFKESGVQFIPIAFPPVYKPEMYGWSENEFLGDPDDSETYLEAARSFIEATEKEVSSGLIPFPEVYYDPKFRLPQNRDERELGPGFGAIYPWQGKLKWPQDARIYGAPAIWFLGRDGTVLAEPFFGNDYDSEPPQINYGFSELKELIERLLQETPD